MKCFHFDVKGWVHLDLELLCNCSNGSLGYGPVAVVTAQDQNHEKKNRSKTTVLFSDPEIDSRL